MTWHISIAWLDILSAPYRFLEYGPYAFHNDQTSSTGLWMQQRCRSNPAIRMSLTHKPVISCYPPNNNETLDQRLNIKRAGDREWMRLHNKGFVDYVMGDGWREQCYINHTGYIETDCTGGELWHEYDQVYRPSWSTVSSAWTGEDVMQMERDQCLRMRRCAATDLHNRDDLIESNGLTFVRMYPIFGWCSAGLWLLPSPARQDIDYINLDDDDPLRAQLESWDQVHGRLSEGVRTMTEVCSVLEEAGATYYANPRDCEEAVWWGLG